MGPLVIVGAGAIGSWLAVYTSRHRQEVHLLARAKQAQAIHAAGLEVERLAGLEDDAQAGHIQAGDTLQVVDNPHGLPKQGAVVLFAVRAYQTREAAEQLAAAGVEPAGVVTLQNGLGNAEALATVFSEDKVAAGTTSHGVTALSPGRVRHTGWGEIDLGAWTPTAKPVVSQMAKWLTDAGLGATIVAQPRLALWRKVAVNAAINPPTALKGIENGMLLDGGPLEKDLRAAACEVARVAQAEGVALSEEEAERSALQVARRTARNRSSMLQALEAGRPLETDAITGEVVRRAHDHGIKVPVNRRHLEALRRLVAGSHPHHPDLV